MKEDFVRRDFTINAIYIDMNGKIYDFSSGISDLNGHLIRTIGEPRKRIKEDPLRILRAIRFSLVYDFEIEESLYFAIKRYGNLLSEVSDGKIVIRIKKDDKITTKLIDNMIDLLRKLSFDYPDNIKIEEGV